MEIRRVRLVMLGDEGVGKTALASRYFDKKPLLHYDPTIEDSLKYPIQWEGQDFSINLLDTGGQEPYQLACWDRWTQNGDGYMIVYSVAAPTSFETAKMALCQLRQARENNPCILVANKLDTWAETTCFEKEIREGEKLAEEKDCHFYQTSASTDRNVSDAFENLISVAISSKYPQKSTAETSTTEKLASRLLENKRSCNVFGTLWLLIKSFRGARSDALRNANE